MRGAVLAAVVGVTCLWGEGEAQALDRIVFIADSHGVGSWGQGIEEWLIARQATQYDFFASGASAPRQWQQTSFTTPCGFHETSETATRKKRQCYTEATPHLKDLWDQQPEFVVEARKISVIALGTNYPMTGRASEVTVTKKLIKDAYAKSQVCVWVGPPHMTKKPDYTPEAVEYKYGIIKEAIDAAAAEAGKPKCTLIDSRPLSHYPTHGGDGVHYHWLNTKDVESLGEASKWAKGVTAAIDAALK